MCLALDKCSGASVFDILSLPAFISSSYQSSDSVNYNDCEYDQGTFVPAVLDPSSTSPRRLISLRASLTL